MSIKFALRIPDDMRGKVLKRCTRCKVERWCDARQHYCPRCKTNQRTLKRVTPKIPKIPEGYKRQWVQCKEKKCKRLAYYDYIPYSLSNPITIMPCGHGLGQRWGESVKFISSDEAITLMASGVKLA